MASLIFNWKRVEAESRILKQSSEQRERQFSEPLKCLKMWECLSEASGGVYWFHQYNRHSVMNFKNIVWIIKAISYFVLLRSFNNNSNNNWFGPVTSRYWCGALTN